MIVRRLAAFFTLLSFVFFSATWLIRKMFGYPTADVTAMFTQGVVIIVAYFMIGMFVAKMGIALVKEVVEDKRQLDEEKRERARNLYLDAISGGKGMGLNADGLDIAAHAAASTEEGAAEKNKADGKKAAAK